MFAAMTAIMTWAHSNFKPDEVYLRVLNDNNKGIQFYKRSSFIEEKRIPLKKIVDGDVTKYVESEDRDVDSYFLRMTYAPPVLTNPQDIILTAGPLVSAFEHVYVADAARHGWNRQWNEYISKFESSFLSILGRNTLYQPPRVQGLYI